MSTHPKTIAIARQESTGYVAAPSEAGESTHVRKMAAGRGDDAHDTIPCRPPVVDAPTRRNDLERTLRFARLVRDTLADNHPLTRLLELAILRRDAALLQGLLKELHRQQTAEAETLMDAAPRRSDRITLLPPPPKPR